MNALNAFFPTRHLRDLYICKIFDIKDVKWDKNVLDERIVGVESVRLKSQYKKIPGYWISIKFNNEENSEDIKRKIWKLIPYFWLEENVFFPKELTSARQMEEEWVKKYDLAKGTNDLSAWKLFLREVQQHFREGRGDVSHAGLIYIYRKNPYFLKKYKRYYLFEDLAYYYETKGELHQSIRCLKSQATLQPGSSESYLNMSSFLLLHGMNEEAINICRQGLEINPDDEYLSNNLLVGYFNEDDFDKALEYTKNLIEKNPHSSTNWKLLGDIFCQIGNEELAIKCYQEALKINSFDLSEIELDIYYGLSICYQQLGKFNEAIKYYKTILERNHRDLSVLLNLSKLYGQDLKEYDKAEIYAKKIVEIYPQNGYGHHNLGLIYLYTSRLEKAKWHLYKARRLIPDYGPVHDAIIELKREKKNHSVL